LPVAGRRLPIEGMTIDDRGSTDYRSMTVVTIELTIAGCRIRRSSIVNHHSIHTHQYNRQSSIRRSPITNRQSADRQSPTVNRQ